MTYALQGVRRLRGQHGLFLLQLYASLVVDFMSSPRVLHPVGEVAECTLAVFACIRPLSRMTVVVLLQKNITVTAPLCEDK